MRDPKKVLLAMPVRGDGCTRYETSHALLAAFAAPELEGWNIEIIPVGGGDVAHARNSALQWVRTKTDASLLLQVDSDLRFTGLHIAALLEWTRKGVGFVAGRYPLKDLRPRWSYNGPVKTHKSGLLEPWETCCGFSVMTYGLIEELVQANLDTRYEYDELDAQFSGQTGYEIFAMGPVIDERTGKIRRMSEDFYLSKRLRAIGVPVLVDASVRVGHIGSFDLLRIMEASEEKL